MEGGGTTELEDKGEVACVCVCGAGGRWGWGV